MDRQNLSRLSPEQLVLQIRQACEELEEAARYMGEASLLLHTKTRRPDFREAAARTARVPSGAAREVEARIRAEAVSDISSVYTLYANTWQRFAGMVLQGVRRTTSSERIMKRLEEKQILTSDPEPEEAPPTPKTETPTETPLLMEDLVALYGVETVTHAQQ